MSDTWYNLEILPLSNDIPFYTEITNHSSNNAGFDLFAASSVSITDSCEFIPFGIAVRMVKVTVEKGAEKESESHFWLAPRSSIYKSGLTMANSFGVIDKSYRGELKAPVWSMTKNSKVKAGDRLFQIVAPDMGWIRNIRVVDSLPDTERGAGGFGSTGL
jgi:dUTP pyrophosphatase